MFDTEKCHEGQFVVQKMLQEIEEKKVISVVN